MITNIPKIITFPYGQSLEFVFENRNIKLITFLEFKLKGINHIHKYFSITGELYDKKSNKLESCGLIHDDIIKRIPQFKPYIKWHLCGTDGPLHYIPNTLYWLEHGHLEIARKCAIWEDATMEQLSNKELLEERLPALLNDFKNAMEELGFTY